MKKSSLLTSAACPVTIDQIQSRILVVEGVQVMLDHDLAELYGVEVRRLNEQVSRNIERFPVRFMRQLTQEEFTNLKSQIATSSLDGGACADLKSQIATSRWGGVRKPPRVFTEQGISMLSAVLRSPTAIDVSIRIMDAFVAMRTFLLSMAPVWARIEENERRQMAAQAEYVADRARNEDRFRLIFDAMREKKFPPQKVFFDGQVFDADAFATRHILSAKKSILLIDSWVDVVTLELLAKKTKGVTVDLVASPRGNKLSASDVAKFNAQYGGLTVRVSRNFHDRFLIVDDKKLYLFGASLKDLGLKCFAFTELDAAAIPELKRRV